MVDSTILIIIFIVVLSLCCSVSATVGGGVFYNLSGNSEVAGTNVTEVTESPTKVEVPVEQTKVVTIPVPVAVTTPAGTAELIDGSWSEWYSITKKGGLNLESTCLIDNGNCSGKFTQTRFCTPPKKGGKPCVGPDTRTTYCENAKCKAKVLKLMNIDGVWTNQGPEGNFVKYPGVNVGTTYGGSTELFKMSSTNLTDMIKECNNNTVKSGTVMNKKSTGCSAFVTQVDPIDPTKIVGYYTSWALPNTSTGYYNAKTNVKATRDSANKLLYNRTCSNSTLDPTKTSYLSRGFLHGIPPGNVACSAFNIVAPPAVAK